MAIKIMHDVETRDLEDGDIVIRNDEDQTFMCQREIPGSDYVELTWTERASSTITWQTTAEPWNTWPIVIREH